MQNKSNENSSNLIYNSNNSGLYFSFATAVMIIISVAYSLIITTMAKSLSVSVEEISGRDGIIILSFALASISTLSAISLFSVKYKKNVLLLATKPQKPYIVSLAVLLITFGFIFGLAEVNALFVEFLNGLGLTIPQVNLPNKSVKNVILTIIFVCLLPAVLEELFFRGLILKGLENFGEVIAIVISASLFSIYHMSPAQTIYQFLVGCLYAFITLRAKSVLPTIISHFINNLFIVLNYYYFNLVFVGALKILLCVLGLISLIIGVLILVFFVKKDKENTQEKGCLKNFFIMATLGISICLVMWISALF